MILLDTLLVCLCWPVWLVAGDLNCRPEGPVLPKPTSLPDSPIFHKAASNFTDTLNAAVSKSINAGWVVENVSFSLAVISADQEDPGVPVWEYHHLASGNTRGTKNLNRDSQYLIGSITKVFSDYVLLKSGIDIDAPVTRFLPRLNDPNSTIHWQNVSLRMLASHLSGAPANYGFSEFYFLKEVFLSYGLPPIEDIDYPPCGVTGLNGPCSPQDTLDGMTKDYWVTAPMERPAYSNVAFTIFGMALEEFTGKNYSQLVEEIVAEPLELENTFPSPGDDKKAVIPPLESTWGADYGYNAPPGGLVSSISDLSKFAHALLSRTLDLTPTEIRQWLKPNAFAGGPYSMVGMPWEIFRPLNLTANHPHPITVYGKSGGAQGYRSQLSVLDEYGFALVVLTAGPMQAAPILVDSMMAAFIPAIDEVSRSQAKAYERNFTSKSSGDGDVIIQASLEQDNDSLLISSLHRNGSDLLTGLAELWTVTLGEFLAPVGPIVRLFPSDLTENVTIHGKTVTREVWHLWPDVVAEIRSALPGTGLASLDCVTWTIGDWVHYGGEPLDRVLLYKDEGDQVEGFEIPFLRSGMLIPF